MQPIHSIPSFRSLRILALLVIAPFTAPAANAPTVRDTLNALVQYAEANAQASGLYTVFFPESPDAIAYFRGREAAFHEVADYIRSLNAANAPATESVRAPQSPTPFAP